MVDVKPEILLVDIADGIYMKFQRNPHIVCVEKQGETNICTTRRKVKEKAKMGSYNRKWISQHVYMIATKFQRLCLCFRGRATRLD